MLALDRQHDISFPVQTVSTSFIPASAEYLNVCINMSRLAFLTDPTLCTQSVNYSRPLCCEYFSTACRSVLN